ncbi:MAG: tRNA (adenosine(37)-N6)-threonylcarbamoyltransferase complex transferase subunit TsaD [Thermogemmatispora sp.]|uniref:tRNA (adenosine(37)-N6)-threonylcarbamoyltransferase complex transferase subunit TsaD n=1 Tax=Thermogemmatispora sp. TaxID=1968838 RepID=UPI0019E64BC3|nr:tRNA (adenosine(37)-N6)-threonylcarbamoyltransferase complex transferase subunit TsaD [Thermogemmatispora sp.]MBE3565331.1 tRNA (adenosine(37)-N6)-threonylcarbamoyltransferase complex transferase subunit TsaD [Thermogemmatispora sp.]
MLVLGIESSCDETGAAIVKDGRYLLANVVASQTEIHERYGGVVPEVASRQQLAAILPVIETALQQAHCRWEDIEAVAATYGPGLAGSLLVGLTVGKTLALARDLPFLGVNHLEAHIYANWLRQAPDTDLQTDASETESAYLPGDPLFPLICLVVSGAHSELVLMRDHTDYLLLGRTRDDAAGEAFDKVARILGLGYPGGPAIQRAARLAEEELRQQRLPVRNPYRLPRAWLRGTYDFSFSGLKTAMLHLAEGLVADQQPGRPLPSGGRQVSRYTTMGSEAARHGQVHIGLLAAGFQEAIVDVLAVKTRMAAQEYHVRQVLLAGGVAANVALRARLEEELTPLGIRLQYPPIEFCTDNAAMVAAAAFFHRLHGEQHDLDLDVEPNLSLPFRQE